MKRSCACAAECGQRAAAATMQGATCDYHGSSPSRNCAASGEAGCLKKRSAGGALREPALVQEQDLVAQAVRLAEVVRHHHDLGAGRVQRGDDLLDLVRRARVEARRRLVEEQDFRSQRPHAGEREPLLLAAGEHARRAAADRLEADLAQRLLARRLALAPRNAGELQRVGHVARAPNAAACTGRWNTIACRRGPPASSGDVPRDRTRRSARSKPVTQPQQHALARAVRPEDDGARRRARSSRETPSMMRRDPTSNTTSSRRERQQRERRAHVHSAAHP